MLGEDLATRNVRILFPWLLRMIVSSDISKEFPYVDAIALANADDLRVVSWIEYDGLQWISMPNEALEKVWRCLLGFVVPDLDHVVLAAGEHVP